METVVDLSLTPAEKRKLAYLLIIHDAWQQMNWAIGVHSSNQPPEIVLRNSLILFNAEQRIAAIGT